MLVKGATWIFLFQLNFVMTTCRYPHPHNSSWASADSVQIIVRHFSHFFLAYQWFRIHFFLEWWHLSKWSVRPHVIFLSHGSRYTGCISWEIIMIIVMLNYLMVLWIHEQELNQHRNEICQILIESSFSAFNLFPLVDKYVMKMKIIYHIYIIVMHHIVVSCRYGISRTSIVCVF